MKSDFFLRGPSGASLDTHSFCFRWHILDEKTMNSVIDAAESNKPSYCFIKQTLIVLL